MPNIPLERTKNPPYVIRITATEANNLIRRLEKDALSELKFGSIQSAKKYADLASKINEQTVNQILPPPSGTPVEVPTKETV